MSNKYSKDSGNRELNIIEQKNENISVQYNKIDKVVPEGYKKKDGDLDPSLFIIVSGGEKRERDYFYIFQNKSYTFPRIKVEFICEDEKGIGGLDVDKMVEVSLNIKKNLEETKGNDILDSINLITDVDHFYTQLERNIALCKENELNLIISNPSFEIWLYYSYYDEIPDYNIPDDKLKISSGFKTYLNSKHSGGIDPRYAPLEIEQAILNSKKNYSLDQKEIPILFSTQMHIIAEKLYELTKDEIIRIRKEREEKQQKYLSGNKLNIIAKKLSRLSYNEVKELFTLVKIMEDKSEN